MHRRIQLNAFLMTLRKKQLLGPFGLLYTYFALIGSLDGRGAQASSRRVRVESLATGALLYLLRRRGVSKYVLWPSAIAVRTAVFRVL